MTLSDIPRDSFEFLFINAFDLPDTRYNRLAGAYCGMLLLALQLRCAFRKELLTPQFNFIICGPEGNSKSTFCKVLAGDRPGDTRTTERYTDAVDLKDLVADDDRADARLYRKVRGCTVVEWADKRLAFGAQMAGVLKAYTNKGSLKFRPLYSNDLETYYCRHVNFFTTNAMDFMTEEMGSRRWIVVDTHKSLRRSAAERAESLEMPLADVERRTSENKNPGLNWVALHLSAMFRRMHATDLWTGDLNLSVEMIGLMKAEQSAHVQGAEWNEIFTNDFAPLKREGVGFKALDVAKYVQHSFAKPPSAIETAALLRELGFDRHQKSVSGRKLWYWHPADVALTAIDGFAEWQPDSHRAGRFVRTKTPSPGQSEILEAVARNQDRPF